VIKLAVIGGTGVTHTNILTNIREETMETPYGQVPYMIGELDGREIAFIYRHGRNHTIPPHLINFRANIWALKRLGVQQIIASGAVGSLNLAMKPGDFVIIDQFIDFTKSRINTFFEGGDRGVVHVDVTNPYCGQIRNTIMAAAEQIGLAVHKVGTYVCTEGPRFETPAEIAMYAKLGADVVGMTNVPEVALAREAEMCYATVAIVTNYAAGISPQPLTHGEVLDIARRNKDNTKRLFKTALSLLDPEKDCACRHALVEYGGFKL